MKVKGLSSVFAAALLVVLTGQASADEHEHHKHRLSIRVVHEAPPAPRVVERVPSPGANYVYTNGYWDYTNDRWNWVDGRWASPPAAGVTWVDPEYAPVDGGTRYVPGHWSNEDVYDERGRKYARKMEKKMRHEEHERQEHEEHEH
jgi:hypothetical protein